MESDSAVLLEAFYSFQENVLFLRLFLENVQSFLVKLMLNLFTWLYYQLTNISWWFHGCLWRKKFQKNLTGSWGEVTCLFPNKKKVHTKVFNIYHITIKVPQELFSWTFRKTKMFFCLVQAVVERTIKALLILVIYLFN